MPRVIGTQPMLTVIGEAVIDLIQDPDGRYTAHPGGSPLNVAAGLARLGETVWLKARFSTDAFGRQLQAHATTSGVNLTYAVDADEPATIAAVSVAEDQTATYSFYMQGTADWQWTQQQLSALPSETQLLHTGSLAAIMPPGAEFILARVRAARAAGITISYDPNIRPLLAGTAEQGRLQVEDFAETADLVKASDQDLAWLYPNHEPHQVAQRWLALGAKMAVVTLGAAGALAVTNGWSMHRPAPAVKVIDTVGAGDAFTAGLLSALVRSAAHQRLQTLDPDEAAPIVDTAIEVASITCTRAGANPPTHAELTRLAEFAASSQVPTAGGRLAR